jgi:hypothetical protein
MPFCSDLPSPFPYLLFSLFVLRWSLMLRFVV